MAVSSSILIKQETESDEIYIIESSNDDEPQIKKFKQESVNDSTISLDIPIPAVDTGNNSVIESCGSNDTSVVKNFFKKVQWKTKTKHSMTCEVCKRHFKSRLGLVYHRRTHLDILNHFCRCCLQSFSSNFYRDLHEESCKYVIYECYLCGVSRMSLLGLQTHFRVHTEMRSFHIGHAIDKYYTNKKTKLQRIDERSHKEREIKAMAQPQEQQIDVVIDLTED